MNPLIRKPERGRGKKGNLNVKKQTMRRRMTYICAKGQEGLRGKGKENDKEIEEQDSQHKGAAGGAPSDKMSKKASDL